VTLRGVNQHIAENWHRGTRTDNIEDLLQAVAKMILVDLELHGLNFSGILELLAMLIY
jgi:hypothetical protein